MSSNFKSTAWEVIKMVILTLIIVIPIRTYIAQPFIVSGASMYPTFEDKEYLIVDEASYLFRKPTRGEVIIFRYPKNPKKFFIKRIIGLPGEQIVITNNKINILRDGQIINVDEPYLQSPENPLIDTELSLKDNEYFVMGDNRDVSFDSRNWGALPGEMITGRALVRLFPPARLAILPGAPGNY
ncbi:MAG: signal peptidase I [Patescibacteria group bacterium]|nr:signal peptidase I [Patescibacteria group bacterium]